MICFPAAGALSSLPAVGVERRGFDFIPDSRCSVTRFKTRDAASLMGRMLNIPSFSLRLLFQRSEKEFRNAQKVFAESENPTEQGASHEYDT